MDNNFYYKAYKIVDGKEVEGIDPLVSLRFEGDLFYIYNGFHEYEQPIQDFKLWNVRKVQIEEEGR